MIGRPHPADVKTPAGETDERRIVGVSGRRRQSARIRALPNGRAAPYDRRASCLFYVESARPPEAFHANIIGAETRGAKRLRVLVTYN